MEGCVDENSNPLPSNLPRGATYERLAEEYMKVLASSLGGFQGDVSHLLTLLINPRDDYSKVERLLREYFERLNGEGIDSFNLKALNWVIKKINGVVKWAVPPNGLAVFAGVTKVESSDNSFNLARVIVSFEPSYKLNSSVYKWDKRFHPDILLANPRSMAKKFGLLILSKRTITISCYAEDENDVEYAEYSYNAKNIREEIIKIQKLTSKMFMAENKTTITGIVVGFARNLTQELSSIFRNSEKMLEPGLLTLVGKTITVSEEGFEGVKEAIMQTSKFREEAWFAYLKGLIEEKQCSEVDLFQKEVDLEEVLKNMGLGTMELITATEGVFSKKVETHFGNIVNKVPNLS